MSLAIGYSYYNDLKSIKRGLPTFIDEVDCVIAIDGRYSMREGNDLSDDGSTEYLKQFGNVTFSEYVGYEHDKRNRYLVLASELGVKYVMVLDSDEYVIEADWELFRNNLNMLQRGIHGVIFDIKSLGGHVTYPRIIVNPEDWRYHNAHCVMKNINGDMAKLSSCAESTVNGIICGYDDSLRSSDYLRMTDEYQKKLIEYEKPFRNNFS